MPLAATSLIVFLLVGIMPVSLAAPDQTAEWEKVYENGDANDVSVVAESPNHPAKLEKEDENGHMQRIICRQIYFVCLHRYGRRCQKACFYDYYVCFGVSNGLDAEEYIPGALTAQDQLAEFEEKSETGDGTHRVNPLVCLRIYYFCTYYYTGCTGACLFGRRKCLRGRGL